MGLNGVKKSPFLEPPCPPMPSQVGLRSCHDLFIDSYSSISTARPSASRLTTSRDLPVLAVLCLAVVLDRWVRNLRVQQGDHGEIITASARTVEWRVAIIPEIDVAHPHASSSERDCSVCREGGPHASCCTSLNALPLPATTRRF